MKLLQKLSYLVHVIFLQMKTHIRLNILLVFSLVLGMMIPIFILGNMAMLKQSSLPKEIKRPEKIIVLDTGTGGMLNETEIEKLMGNTQISHYTFSLMAFLTIPEIKEENIQVSANSENEGNGEINSQECVISKNVSKDNSLKIGDTLTILGDTYKIIAVTENRASQVTVSASSLIKTLESHHSQAQQWLYFESPSFDKSKFEQEIQKIKPQLSYSLNSMSELEAITDKSIQPYLKIEKIILIICLIFIVINMFSIMSEKAILEAKFMGISRAMGLDLKGMSFIIFGELFLIMLVAYILLVSCYLIITKINFFSNYLVLTPREYFSVFGILTMMMILSGSYTIFQLNHQPIYASINKKEVI